MGLVNNKLAIQRTYFTGMNSYDEATEIGANQCADIQNGFVNKAGQIVQRKGLTEIESTILSGVAAVSGLSGCVGLGNFSITGVSDKLYRVERTNLYVLSGAAWQRKKTDLTTSLSTTFTQAVNKLFLFNGTDNVFSIASDGTITDEGSTTSDPPKGTVAEFHDNRLFVVDTFGDVNFSDIRDPQTFNTALNKFSILKGAKGAITAIKSFKEKELTIYKTDSIVTLDTTGATPLTDWEIRLFNPSIGCPAGKTVVQVGNDHIFLANDGVRILTRTQFDTIQEGVVSREVQNIIDNINWIAISKARAVYYDNKYILAIPTGTSTENNEILIYDLLATLEANRRGIAGNSWVRIPDGNWDASELITSKYNTTPELIAGWSSSSKIYSALKGNLDDTSIVNMSIDFRKESFDRKDVDKKFSHVFSEMDGGENTLVQFFYKVNDSSISSTSPSILDLTGSTPVLPIALPFNLNDDTRVVDELYIKDRGKTCQLSMLHSLSGTATFKGYHMYANLIGQTEE